MKKFLLPLLILLTAVQALGQAVDTTTLEKKARFHTSWIKDNAVQAITPLDLRRAFGSITNLTVRRTMYLTAAELRAGVADTTRAVTVTDPLRRGIFVYDPADVSSADDSAMVIRAGTRRYKRLVTDNRYSPEWWGVTGNGVTNDRVRMQRALDYAWPRRGETIIATRYVIDGEDLIVRSSISGNGTILTRNGARVMLQNRWLKARGFTINGAIDGTDTGTANGGGIGSDGGTDLSVTDINVRNVVGQAFWFRRSHRTVISHCIADNSVGWNGDSFYFGLTIEPKVIGCTGTRFQRIGLVFEGSDTNQEYTRDAVAIGNTFSNSVENTNPVDYPNGGIWGENVAGATITGNRVWNVHSRGIVLAPSIANESQYEYIMANNDVRSVLKNTNNLRPTGYAFSYAGGQVLSITDNICIDVAQMVEVGYMRSAQITGNTFAVKSMNPDSVRVLAIVPSISANYTSEVLVANNIANIKPLKGLLVGMPDVFGQKANLVFRNNIGNWALSMAIRTLVGSVTYENCTLDYSSIALDRFLVNCSATATFKNCDIKLNKSNTVGLIALEAIFSDTKMYADSARRIDLYPASPAVYRVTNGSRFSNIFFSDIRRANTEIYLSNSTFDGYSSAGLFRAVGVMQVANVEVDGCQFSKTETSQPFQFSLAPTASRVGSNYFASQTLGNFTFATTFQMGDYGTTAQRPSSPHLGYVYNDNSIGRRIVWNGVSWTGPASYITNSTATSEPSKSNLNTAYGGLMEGSKIRYTNISGGTIEFEKMSGATNGDWVKTIWGTGIKSLVP